MSDYFWGTPTATSEARGLLPLARAYGVAAAREIIAVTPQQESELVDATAWDSLFLNRVTVMLRWREQVLVEFDKLVAKEEARKYREARNALGAAGFSQSGR